MAIPTLFEIPPGPAHPGVNNLNGWVTDNANNWPGMLQDTTATPPIPDPYGGKLGVVKQVLVTVTDPNTLEGITCNYNQGGGANVAPPGLGLNDPGREWWWEGAVLLDSNYIPQGPGGQGTGNPIHNNLWQMHTAVFNPPPLQVWTHIDAGTGKVGLEINAGTPAAIIGRRWTFEGGLHYTQFKAPSGNWLKLRLHVRWGRNASENPLLEFWTWRVGTDSNWVTQVGVGGIATRVWSSGGSGPPNPGTPDTDPNTRSDVVDSLYPQVLNYRARNGGGASPVTAWKVGMIRSDAADGLFIPNLSATDKFGKQTIGPIQVAFPTFRAVGSKFVAPHSGRLAGVGVYLDPGPGTTWVGCQVNIHAHNAASNIPGAFLAGGRQIWSRLADGPRWQEVRLPRMLDVVGGQTYWLLFAAGHNANANLRYRVADEGVGTFYEAGSAVAYPGGGQSGYVNPPGANQTTTPNRTLSVYGIYEATAGTIPVNTAAPVVTGQPRVGQVLASTTGAWSNNPTSFRWKWRRADNAAFTSNVSSVDPDIGVYRGSGLPANVDSFGTWLGRPMDMALDFNARSTWAELIEWSWWIQQWAGRGYKVVYSVAMLPASGATLANGAAGAYDSNFVSLAQDFVSGGAGDAIIRLGWEFNGNWYPWSAIGQEANFASYWQRIVNAMRGVSGANFKFDWCATGGWNINFNTAYPGDSYVDYIGLDMYAPEAHGLTSFSQLQTITGASLNWHSSFAASHSKPMTYPEWGLWNEEDTGYIQGMFDWFVAQNVAYQMYFDAGIAEGASAEHKLANFTTSQALYKQLFAVAPSSNVLLTSSESSKFVRSEVVAVNAAGSSLPKESNALGPITASVDAYRDNTLGQSGLAVYWRLADTDGVMRDSSPAALNGAYNGGYTHGLQSAVAGGDAATSFNGTTGYASKASAAGLDVGDVFTLEFWFKRLGGIGVDYHTLLAKGPNGFNVRLAGDNKLLFRKSGVGAAIATSSSTITDTTTWHHCVVTKNGATSKIYLDGADVTSVGTNQTIENTAFFLRIGAEHWPPGGDGTLAMFANVALDEIAIYNVEKAASFASARYALGTGTPTTVGIFSAGSSFAAVVTSLVPLVEGALFSAGSSFIGSVSQTSTSVPANTAAPVASGTATVGQTVSVTNGSWTNVPTSFSYAWERADDSGFTTNVASIGANQNTYVLTSAETSKFVRCRVTASNAAGPSAPAASNSLGPVAGAPINSVAPVISGTPAVGQTLTATTGTWIATPAPSFAYQWQRALPISGAPPPVGDPSWANIAAATSSTHVLGASSQGYYVRVRVTATNASGSTNAFSNVLGTVTAAPPAPAPDFPQVFVEIAWASNPLEENPVWTDVSADVQQISISRGRPHELSRFDSGTCHLRLNDKSGKYDPGNSGSPYAPNVIPMRQLRIRATYEGTTYPLFRGFVPTWTPHVVGVSNAEVEIEAVDALSVLANLGLNGATFGFALSGQRFSDVMSAIGWPWGLLDFRIQEFQSTITDAEEVEETALEHLQMVEGSEMGALFATGAGKVTFRDRRWHIELLQGAPVESWGDNLSAGQLPYTELLRLLDADHIYNHAVVTLPDWEAGEYEDVTSQAKFLKRTVSLSTGLYYPGEADGLASALVWRYKNPRNRIGGMEIHPALVPALEPFVGASRLWKATLGLEIGQFHSLAHGPPGGGIDPQDLFIAALSHDIGPGKQWHSSVVFEAPDPVTNFWKIGDPTYGKLDTGGVLAY